MTIAILASTTNSHPAGGSTNIIIPASGRVAGAYAILPCVVATSLSTGSFAITLTTSAGINLDQIGVESNSSYSRMAIFRRFIESTGETFYTFTGTGQADDTIVVQLFVFSGVSTSIPEDVALPVATTGNSSNPDSPSITPVSANCAIITTMSFDVGDAVNGPLVPTSPISSWNSSGYIFEAGTNTAGVAGAWATNAPVAPFDPGPWTTRSVVNWNAFTIALRPTVLPSTWQNMYMDIVNLTKVSEMVGY